MKYAIVDIETTGGAAEFSGITEIAIRISNGMEVIDSFTSLINPERPIPSFIQALTGIHDELVKESPTFSKIAPIIYSYLDDKVFVAHNVQFDFSFIHKWLKVSGFDLNPKKLCTVRLSRKILPGIPSYSLGKLTRYLSIPHESRHRAGGDADATAHLFHHLIQSDKEGFIQKSILKKSSIGNFPPKINADILSKLPESTGVYYFKDEKGKVIYIGKAINIKKRIFGHFSSNSDKKQRQDFILNIADIETCSLPSELWALLYESHEIKRLWPKYNQSQKWKDNTYGIFSYTDRLGFVHLGIDKIKLTYPCLYTFDTYRHGVEMLQFLIKEFELDPSYCSLGKRTASIKGNAFQVLDLMENKKVNNEKMDKAMGYLREYLNRYSSMLIMDKGLKENEQSCILLLKGELLEIGYIPKEVRGSDILNYRNQFKAIKLNSFIRSILLKHAAKFPESVFFPFENGEVLEGKRDELTMIHDSYGS